MATCVHLVGGASLDNSWGRFYSRGNFTDGKNETISAQVQKRLGAGFIVYNHAYDGLSAPTILTGRSVEEITRGRFGADNDTNVATYWRDRKIERTAFIQPLVDLGRVVSVKSGAVHHVVISNFSTPAALSMLLDEIRKNGDVRPIAVLNHRAQFIEKHGSRYDNYSRYTKIVTALVLFVAVAALASGVAFIAHKINRYVSGAILVTSLSLLAYFYRQPNLRHMVLNVLMGRDAVNGQMRDMILMRTKKEKVTVLDMIKTHEGHPSVATLLWPAEEEALIAEGIAQIVKDGEGSKGLVYSKEEKELAFSAYVNF